MDKTEKKYITWWRKSFLNGATNTDLIVSWDTKLSRHSLNHHWVGIIPLHLLRRLITVSYKIRFKYWTKIIVDFFPEWYSVRSAHTPNFNPKYSKLYELGIFMYHQETQRSLAPITKSTNSYDFQYFLSSIFLWMIFSVLSSNTKFHQRILKIVEVINFYILSRDSAESRAWYKVYQKLSSIFPRMLFSTLYSHTKFQPKIFKIVRFLNFYRSLRDSVESRAE